MQRIKELEERIEAQKRQIKELEEKVRKVSVNFGADTQRRAVAPGVMQQKEAPNQGLEHGVWEHPVLDDPAVPPPEPCLSRPLCPSFGVTCGPATGALSCECFTVTAELGSRGCWGTAGLGPCGSGSGRTVQPFPWLFESRTEYPSRVDGVPVGTNLALSWGFL